MLYLMIQVADDPRTYSFRNTEKSEKWTRQVRIPVARIHQENLTNRYTLSREMAQ